MILIFSYNLLTHLHFDFGDFDIENIEFDWKNYIMFFLLLNYVVVHF